MCQMKTLESCRVNEKRVFKISTSLTRDSYGKISPSHYGMINAPIKVTFIGSSSSRSVVWNGSGSRIED